jgi:carboxyl-terminal processing protease
MNKKISLGFAITLTAICCAITFVLTSSFSLETFNSSVQGVKERAEIYKKLDTIDNYIRNYYIGDVDQEKLLDSISEGYMKIIHDTDKYAGYTPASEYEKTKKADNGYRVGIGITASPDESGYILIKEVAPNSSAEEMGLQVGELIIAVNGDSVISKGYEESVKSIAGEVGTTVKLTVRNEGVDREVTLIIKETEIISVNSKMIDDIGYVQITEFNTNTSTQFKETVNSLISSGAKGLIFDVRNNGGGLLTPTLEILDYLLPEGTIATATYKNGKTEVLGTSDKNEIDLPMIVLVNKNTASAAELFSSALRDFDKADLVGSKTYGKGVMQNTYQLQDGSAITFTIAKYQTSKTPNFNGVGLKPNYEVSLENDSKEDLNKLDETTDPQLKKAIEIISTSIK